MTTETYYDFDVNWDSFLKAWYSHDVQYTLALEMECNKPLGFFKYYQPGDPLWKYSQSLYWKLRCAARAQQLMKEEQHLMKFKRTMQSQFGFLNNSKDFYYATCFKATVERCYPQPNTIHAFIMPELSFLLKNTMRQCAQTLFPQDLVEMTNDNIVMINKSIKFDLLGFYNQKYG